MKKVLAIATILVLALIVSCNKNQQAVKKLDGSWILVSINGETIPDSLEQTLTFENCKLKKEEYCDVTTTDANDNSTTTQYQVVDDGTILVTVFVDPSSGTEFEVPASIDELTETTLVLGLSYGTTSSTWTYEKL